MHGLSEENACLQNGLAAWEPASFATALLPVHQSWPERWNSRRMSLRPRFRPCELSPVNCLQQTCSTRNWFYRHINQAAHILSRRFPHEPGRRACPWRCRDDPSTSPGKRISIRTDALPAQAHRTPLHQYIDLPDRSAPDSRAAVCCVLHSPISKHSSLPVTLLRFPAVWCDPKRHGRYNCPLVNFN